MSKRGQPTTKKDWIGTTARRITGLDKREVRLAVFQAFERGDFTGSYFAVRSFTTIRMAAWFRLWCEHACPEFEFRVQGRTHLLSASEHEVIATPISPQVAYTVEERPAATERAIAIRERIVGARLADLKEEADLLLDTGDLSSGSVVFRSDLSRGAALALAGLLDHALNPAGIYTSVSRMGMFEKQFKVSLVVGSMVVAAF